MNGPERRDPAQHTPVYSQRGQVTEDVVDIGAIFAFLWSGKWLIGAFTLLAALGAVAVAVTATPRYTATALIMIEPQTEAEALTEVVEPISRHILDERAIQSQIEILRSHHVLMRAVEEQELASDPEFSGSGEVSDGLAAREALRALGRALDVNQRGLTSVIDISVTTEDPIKSADIAQSVAESFLTEVRESRIERTLQTVEWLDSRITELQEQVRVRVSAFEAFRTVQAADMEERIHERRSELDRLRSSLASFTRTENRERAATVSERIARAETELEDLSAAAVELEELERAASVERNVYERLLQRRQELQELAEFPLGYARIIATALPPLEPSAPDKKVIAVLGTFLGLLLGLGLHAIRLSRRRAAS